MLENLYTWLQEICESISEKVLLVSNNALAFDSRVLANALARAKCDLSDVLSGYTDTLLTFRKEDPKLKEKR